MTSPRPGHLERALLRAGCIAVFVLAAGPGCGDDDAITTECGTFDPDGEPGTDSVIPQDPADPEIAEACEALCDEQATSGGCPVELEACVDRCRLRSCDVCPGSLATLVQCETEFFDPAECTCTGDRLSCESPDECLDALTGTGACGG